MSMIGYVLRVSDAQFTALEKCKDREFLQAFLNKSLGCEGEDYLNLTTLGEISDALDLQYYWHMLHYLLCGEAQQGQEPFDSLLAGDSFGPELSLGKARYLTAPETKHFAAFLSEADFNELFSKVDLNRMVALHVYPLNDRNKGQKAEWAELLRLHFKALRDYLVKAAETGCGYIFWLE